MNGQPRSPRPERSAAPALLLCLLLGHSGACAGDAFTSSQVDLAPTDLAAADSRVDSAAPDAGAPDLLRPDQAPPDTGPPLAPWTLAAGGTADDQAAAVALDSAGNIYITGSFRGKATFGPHTLTAKGGTDIFVARLHPAGKFTWAVSAGGTGDDAGNDLAVDSSGRVHLCGHLSGTATFGSLTSGASGGKDAFLARLDPTGKFVHLAAAGGKTDDLCAAVATDASGGSLVTGQFTGTASFGTKLRFAKAQEDIFVARYSASGQLTWVAGFGGYDRDLARDIATDAAGNSYLAGEFSGTLAFGSSSITPKGYNDVFVAKLDAKGTPAWAAAFGGTSQDFARALTVDSAGRATLAGAFSLSASFGATSLKATYLYDPFVARLDPTGKALWARAVPAQHSAQVNGLAPDSAGGLVLAGTFGDGSGAASWDIDFGGSNGLSSVGGDDAFIARLDPAGKQFSWADAVGGASFDAGNDVALDGWGNRYVVGHFAGKANFGNVSHTAQAKDIFIWKIGAKSK